MHILSFAEMLEFDYQELGTNGAKCFTNPSFQIVILCTSS